MAGVARGVINRIRSSILSTKSTFDNSLISSASFHSSPALFKFGDDPRKWPTYNTKVYPPRPNSAERPPAFVCHMRTHYKYSPDKMWYIAQMIRGMTVDEAIKQLSFVTKKPAQMIIDVIEEAQEMAIRDHNVEYKSNLWIAESFCSKAGYVAGLRRHARGRYCKMQYKYCHYFLRLEEGQPPEHYYPPEDPNSVKLTKWVDNLRKRTIIHSL